MHLLSADLRGQRARLEQISHCCWMRLLRAGSGCSACRSGLGDARVLERIATLLNDSLPLLNRTRLQACPSSSSRGPSEPAEPQTFVHLNESEILEMRETVVWLRQLQSTLLVQNGNTGSSQGLDLAQLEAFKLKTDILNVRIIFNE